MTQTLLAVLGTGLVDPDGAVLRADDEGLTRGDGAFETVLVLTGTDGQSRAVHLEPHLDRLASGAARLDLPPVDMIAWHELIAELLAQWRRPGEAALKLILTRGPSAGPDAGHVTGLASVSPLSPLMLAQRRDGLAVVTLDLGRASDVYDSAPWLLGGVKTLSYALNMAAVREAKRRGADDAIFTSSDGFVLEAPTATVVWWAQDTLLTTPAGATGILVGTAQLALFEAAADVGMAAGHALVTPAGLAASDAVWLVSSVRGVTPVHTLDGIPMPQQPELSAQLHAMSLSAPGTR